MARKTEQQKRTAGFTLIEIAIAMMIVGILLVPALQMYNIHQKQKISAKTTNSLSITQSALGKYVARYGRYPLPADPGIALNAAGSGQSVVGPVATPCTATVTTVCITNTNSVDTLADVDAVADNVLIGEIPYATLGIPYQATLDGYGYKMKYAVTANLTATATFNNGWGAIEVFNNQNFAAIPSVYGVAGSPRGHYVVVSMGADSRGAFNLAGTITAPCGTAANGLDFENCNNDGRFRSNIAQFTNLGAPLTSLPEINSALGANHFDDKLVHTSSVATGIWTFVPNQPSMMSTQNGNIQAGPPFAGCTGNQCLPISKLNVGGNVRIEGSLKTTRICYRGAPTDAGAAACTESLTATAPSGQFRADVIGGTPVIEVAGAGILCQGNKGLQGISNFNEVCNANATVSFSNPGMPGIGCDPVNTGLYPVGITAAGQIICE